MPAISSAATFPLPLPQSPPRLVATDLDGTLLRADGTISARTREALAAAEEAGVEVVFVTARPPRWLEPLAEIVGGHGRVVCLGGAAVWDLATGQALDVCGFDDDDAAALVADLRAAVPGTAFVLERVDGPTFDHTYAGIETLETIQPSWLAPRVEDTLFAGAPPVGKLLALAEEDLLAARVSGRQTAPRISTATQEKFFDVVRDVVGDRAQLAYSGGGGLAELLAPGVSKAAALARWSAREGIDAADVWAFGDMPNDLPMLRWAGVGHAVANAHPAVLAAADAVVASNDDDGVARALEAALTR
ncbi:Cof-like hydrolase [Xylanimonas cellulosilytica DSM 15894]|uniref:Cof-like hydrolase n=1 Tax=Xylanimonas cellulosilytica (strain DSM 15894 / JCM 12276 / CECT 5975 / KCTC 9989 / LMG 20990 / NBRC 107835 / XIL07) TaxID=446471 RepID=D1BW41_XYLCX|nr:HAD family hydrolase [Xylanimonas cellulosilytica]ACZ29544.1 Cof-like hydrolase [Xylanimonas cellulosilytica DSM 15894]